MAPEKNAGRIVRLYKLRQGRQIAAIGIAVFLMAALLWKTDHPGIVLGALSRQTVTALILAVIAAFTVFSALNWRCPSCGRYLGHDIAPLRCRSCGAGFRERERD